MELLCPDGLQYVLSQDHPDQEVSTTVIVNKFRKYNEKARSYIVLNVGVHTATLIKSLVSTGTATKAVSEKLISTYQKESTQFKMNVRTKLHEKYKN